MAAVSTSVVPLVSPGCARMMKQATCHCYNCISSLNKAVTGYATDPRPTLKVTCCRSLRSPFRTVTSSPAAFVK